MMRLVVDTNIIVSAYLNQDGLPFLILKLILSGQVRLYVSEPILAEYEELLLRKTIHSTRDALVCFSKTFDVSPLKFILVRVFNLPQIRTTACFWSVPKLQGRLPG